MTLRIHNKSYLMVRLHASLQDRCESVPHRAK